MLIIGPSGVGKSVILQELRKRHPEFVFPRSATTRARRSGEGDDLYYFVCDEDFSLWQAQGKFLEWAQVHKGARYGTLLSEILPPIEAGKTVVREVDVQGFESIRKHPAFSGDNQSLLQTIFILPDSEQVLADRIRKRAPITDEELSRRIESMKKELSYAPLTDVRVRNEEGKLQQTIEDVEEVIRA